LAQAILAQASDIEPAPRPSGPPAAPAALAAAMLAFLCCKATEISDKTEELMVTAKGKIKEATTDFTQSRLRDALIGEPVTQVHAAPDVFVLVNEVTLQEVQFTGVNAFTLSGVETKVQVRIQGSKKEMTGMVAAQKAGKLFDFMSQGEKALTGALGVQGPGLADRASAATQKEREKLSAAAAGSDEVTVLDFSALFDIEKVAGIEEVKATCTSITSEQDAINKVMSLDMMKKYVETAISQRASRVVTDWQNRTFTLDAAKAQGTLLVASGVAKGGELVEIGRASAAGALEQGAKGVEALKAQAAQGSRR